jgi:hypothetical protein
MHAEVLAKKGLMLYLKNSVEKHQTNIFELEENHLTIHFYVSTAPCGNSVIKKWAKPTVGICYENLSENEWPQPSNEKFHYTAKHEGQGSLLIKRHRKENSGRNTKLKFELPNATQLWSPLPISQSSNCKEETLNPVIHGNKHVRNKPSLTCSDKILLWQHLGLQGSQLLQTGLFKIPLRISTITVGRKYSEPHLRRALFGRYSPAMCMLKKGAPPQQPFSCLVTSLKLDQSVYSGKKEYDDASFTDPRCYWWCDIEANMQDIDSENLNNRHESDCFEILDGKSGKNFELKTPSKISPDLISQNMCANSSNNSTNLIYSVINYKTRKSIMMKYFESVQPTDID